MLSRRWGKKRTQNGYEPVDLTDISPYFSDSARIISPPEDDQVDNASTSCLYLFDMRAPTIPTVEI